MCSRACRADFEALTKVFTRRLKSFSTAYWTEVLEKRARKLRHEYKFCVRHNHFDKDNSIQYITVIVNCYLWSLSSYRGRGKNKQKIVNAIQFGNLQESQLPPALYYFEHKREDKEVKQYNEAWMTNGFFMMIWDVFPIRHLNDTARTVTLRPSNWKRNDESHVCGYHLSPETEGKSTSPRFHSAYLCRECRILIYWAPFVFSPFRHRFIQLR